MNAVGVGDHFSDAGPSHSVIEVLNSPPNDIGPILSDPIRHELIDGCKLLVAEPGRDGCCHTNQYTQRRALVVGSERIADHLWYGLSHSSERFSLSEPEVEFVSVRGVQFSRFKKVAG